MKKIFILLFILISMNLLAQVEDSTQVKYWINLGARTQNKDLSMHYSFNIAFDNLSFSTMLLGTGRILGPNSDGYSTTSVTTSIGYNLSSRYYLFAVFAGPGINWGQNYNYPGIQNFNTICFSTNAQAYFLPIRNLGIGLEYIINLNEEYSFNHFQFSINIIF